MSNTLIDIGVGITLQNHFSAAANGVRRDLQALMSDIRNWQGGLNQGVGYGFELAKEWVSALYGAFKYSAGVQNQVWLASKIAGANAAEQRQMMELAQEVNAQTPLTSANAASMMRFEAMAGASLEEIRAMTPAIAKLGSTLGANVEGKGGLADTVTNMMHTFNLQSGQIEGVTDDLFTAVTNANISIEDLAQSIKYSGAEAASSGIGIRELSASIAVLGNRGIQGSMAGTALGNMLRNLQLSAIGRRQGGYNFLDRIGIKPDDLFTAEGSLKDLSTVLHMLSEALVNVSDKSKLEGFYDLFGVRGTRAAVALMDDLKRADSTYTNIMGLYDQNQGIVNKMNEERLETAQGAIDRLTSTLENLRVTFGKTMEPTLVLIIKAFSSILMFFNDLLKGGIGLFVGQWAIFVAGTMAAVNGFKILSTIVGFVFKGIRSFPSAINSARAATGGLKSSFLALEITLTNIAAILENIRVKIAVLGRGAALASAGIGGAAGKAGGMRGQSIPLVSNPAFYIRNGGLKGSPTYMIGNTRVGTGDRAQARWVEVIKASATSKTTDAINTASTGLKMGVKTGFMSVLGFLGGPWGLGISMALGGILAGVSALKRAKESEEEERASRIRRSAYSYASSQDLNYLAQLDQDYKATKYGNTKLDIRVNGRQAALINFGDSSSLDIGDEGYSDIFGLG